MKYTYETPELLLYGSVEELTGVVGQDISGDDLVINGTVVAQQEKGDDNATSVNCSFNGSGSVGNFSFIGTAGFQTECTETFKEFANNGSL